MNNFENESDTKILTLSCRFLKFKTKKQLHFFSEVEAAFLNPMLSRKTFATNSLK